VQDMESTDGIVRYVPFAKPEPSRRVVLAWRKSFTRGAAIEAVRDAVLACGLNGVEMLPDEAVISG
jgi:LysR family hydrogen peroxide-inducible transcriptional activator